MTEITDKELRKLKKYLPSGYRETLASDFDITVSYVDKILSGNKSRIDVVDRAIELATQNKQRLSEQKNKIKKL